MYVLCISRRIVHARVPITHLLYLGLAEPGFAAAALHNSLQPSNVNPPQPSKPLTPGNPKQPSASLPRDPCWALSSVTGG